MKKEVLKKMIAKPGDKHKVSEFETDLTAGLNKEDAEKLLSENIEKLSKLQDKLYAQDRYSVLVIFQAMDAAGKDGTIGHVMSGINPQGCQVFSFKAPSAEELDHDYLWRIYRCLPERGRIGIFNRSHYEDVLVAKVHPSIVLNGKLPKVTKVEDVNNKFWKKRYRQINDFERHLTENGTIILKFFLNVSHDEQERRFLARLEDETKNWKFSAADLKERQYWDDYMNAYSEMLTHTSTDEAPWYVIPADNKWFMRYAVGQIICKRMERIGLHYPVLTDEAKQSIEDAKKILAENKENTKPTPARTPVAKANKVKTIRDKSRSRTTK
jgi:PPK2 family polyphosphate:nucleotide phosphotransferase